MQIQRRPVPYQYGASGAVQDLMLGFAFGEKLGGEFTMPRDEETTGGAGRPGRVREPTKGSIKGVEGDHRGVCVCVIPTSEGAPLAI